MTKDEALKLAQAALKRIADGESDDPCFYAGESLDAIEQSLAAPVQDPVAWYEHNPDLDAWFLAYTHNPKVKSRPLVFGDTAPPAAQPTIGTIPMQPIEDAGGFLRFKANAIVQHLLSTHLSCDLNKLSRMDFTDEDRMQFAQLIGYSVGGYADLSYVSDESYEAVEKAALGIAAALEKGQP